MKMYKVGGCVRDDILGIASKDIDFTVVLEGNEGPFLGADPFRKMEYELESMGFKIFVSTPEHLTIRAHFPKADEIVTMRFADGSTRVMDIREYKGITSDFVLARIDGDYGDGRRPDKVIPGTLEDDLRRRDFTMNAIAQDPDGNLIDPHKGQEDIAKGIIRAVGDPFDRLNEDALRALRALRFSVQKGFTIWPDLAFAMETAAVLEKIENVISDERIREELNKMLAADTVKSLHAFQRFPFLTRAIFSGSVSLEATMKKRKGK